LRRPCGKAELAEMRKLKDLALTLGQTSKYSGDKGLHGGGGRGGLHQRALSRIEGGLWALNRVGKERIFN